MSELELPNNEPKSTYDLQVLQINSVVIYQDKEVRNIVGEDVVLETKLAPDLWWSKFDLKSMVLVFLNLVANACEAMPEGGNVFVTTELKGDRVEIHFDDKGIGIEHADLKHVFEPLWTKNKINNSGLGLSISQKIIEDHKGSITIKSEKNSGTSVIISLPIH